MKQESKDKFIAWAKQWVEQNPLVRDDFGQIIKNSIDRELTKALLSNARDQYSNGDDLVEEILGLLEGGFKGYSNMGTEELLKAIDNEIVSRYGELTEEEEVKAILADHDIFPVPPTGLSE